LGSVVINMGRAKEAFELLQPALSRYREAYGPDHRSELGTHIAQTLGHALNQLGKCAEAEPLLRRALDECQTIDDTLGTLRLLSASLADMGRVKEAEKLNEQAFDDMKRLRGPTAPVTLNALMDYAYSLKLSGQYSKSNALFRQALRGFEADLRPQISNVLVCMAECGATSRLLGDLNEANKLLRQAMSGFERAVGMGHLNTLKCTFELAECLRDQELYYEALALYQKAQDGYEALYGTDHRDTLCCSATVADLRSILQKRAALHEALKQSSARFDECLQAKKHFRKPALYDRTRALTYPGAPLGTMLRPDSNWILQDVGDDREWSDLEVGSDTSPDVTTNGNESADTRLDVATDAVGSVLLDRRRSV
jgi:tetratricopeptide (TPR) repeat protein